MIIREGVSVYAESGALPKRSLTQLVVKALELDLAEIRRTVAEEASKDMAN